MEGEYRRADIIWGVLELAGHGVRHGKGSSWGPAAQNCFIVFREFHEWVGRASGPSQDCPAIVVPVDYEVGIPQKAHYYSHEESGNGGRVLIGSNQLKHSPGLVAHHTCTRSHRAGFVP